MKIAHISPTYYSQDSVVGGGEKYVVYFCKAMIEGAAISGQHLELALIAFGANPGVFALDTGMTCNVLSGVPWDPNSLSAKSIRDAVEQYSVIFVHQCLSPFGLFIASQAKLVGKTVVGLDHGGGEHPLVGHTPEVGYIFDLFVAYSEFGSRAFADLSAEVELIRGPVDDFLFSPNEVIQDHKAVMAVGRLLPHKGFERIIKTLPEGISLKIFGSPYDEEYKAFLERCSAGKDVKFFHNATDSELREHLHSTGLFVHASSHFDYRGTYYAKPELLGLAPLEALACGIPTLVSTAGSLPELAEVLGCVCFSSDDELGSVLEKQKHRQIQWANKWEIASDLKMKFGLAQFGSRLLTVMANRKLT